MKSIKIIAVIILAFIFLTGLAACGSETEDVSEQQSAEEQAALEEQAAIDQQATDQQATVEQAAGEPDAKVSEDGLIGSWKDITSAERFVNISKNGTEYTYEDNEGKLSATFKDGVLKVKVNDTETCDVYIDINTGHLLSVYQDNISEYEKK